MSSFAYIALGSNLNNPSEQVALAIQRIACFPQTVLLKASSLYKTKALTVAPMNLPDYINAVVKIQTKLEPLTLLNSLLQLEILHGRVRDINLKWHSRTLDCDILLYGEQRLDLDNLKVPHPEMLNRLFVLEPLYEIEPDLQFNNLPLKHYLNVLHLKNEVEAKHENAT